jgi:tRNA A37 N6-isopentenylltransferase MiaA
MTWFKKDTTINWVDMRNPDQAIDSIKEIIK